MAADVNLPPGFELDDSSSGSTPSNLPPGFELDKEPVSKPIQNAPSPILSTVSNAIAQTPLGMAAQGANAIQSGLSKISNAFPIRVPQAAQNVASTLFRGARAAGVGTANAMATQSGFGGQPSDILGVAARTKAAFQPNYQPSNLLEKAGAYAGENAPVVAAGIASPAIGGPLALMAQQAQTGKVSPVPIALGLASKIPSAAGGLAKELGSTIQETGQKMANGVIEILPNTLKRLANKFSENGNPFEAGSAIGQKLVDDGILEGDNAGAFFNNVKNKVNESGSMVQGALQDIASQAEKYGTIENPLQMEAKTILQPLENQANELMAGRLSGTRAMGTPVKQMLQSLQSDAAKHNGFVSFDDIESARKEAGTLWSKTPLNSPKYEQYSQLYGTLAEIRNNAVEQIALNAGNPELANNLQKANSEFHFYDSVLNDVTAGAAKAGVGREGLAAAVSSKMGNLGALYALARGDMKRAIALGIGGKVIPMVENEMGAGIAKEAIKTGAALKNSGALLQNVPKTGMMLANMANAGQNVGTKVLDEQTAKQFLDQAGGIKERARELARKAGYTF